MSSYLIIGLTIIFSAFFSGMEIAYISSDKLRIEMLSKKMTVVGSILRHFQKYRARFLATTLVGNNLALVIYGIFMANLLEPLLISLLPECGNGEIIVLTLQTFTATFIVLITAEFVPKSLFLLNPDLLLSFFSIAKR